MVANLQEFEKQIVAILSAGGVPSVESIGGPDALIQAAPHLAVSPFLTEVVQAIAISGDEDRKSELTNLAIDALTACRNGIVLRDCINVLDQLVEPTSKFANALFECYRLRVLDSTLEPIGRAAALDGGFRFVVASPNRRYSFMDTLIQVDHASTAEFSRWFAKIVGLMNSYWPDGALKVALENAASIAESADEASFELGMLFLAVGLSSVLPQEAKEAFCRARELFLKSEKAPGERPDALMYAMCLQILVDFYDQHLDGRSGQIAVQLETLLGELVLYHRSDSDPPWMRARSAELVLWRELGWKLKKLDDSFLEAAWFEPAAIIESYLIPIYRASRAILLRDEGGGIESLVQPAMVGRISENPSFSHVVREWLRQNADSVDAGAVSDLVAQMDGDNGLHRKRVILSGRIREEVVTAFLEQSQLRADDQRRLATLFQSTLGTWYRNLTAVQTEVLTKCIASVEDHPDYHDVPDVQVLFDSILLWTVTFVSTRLELMSSDEPALTYLFRTKGKNRARESELQRDFMQYLGSCVPGTRIEVTNVGGGRADVFVQLGAEKLVVEVKRESVDCSFDALSKAYSEQTFDYQNVSARLGFMLVLDQSDRGGASTHLSALFRTVQLKRLGEIEPRSILIVKIPGERLRPSELSKKGKTDLAAQRKSQQNTRNRKS